MRSFLCVDTADLLENLDEWAQKQWIDHVVSCIILSITYLV